MNPYQKTTLKRILLLFTLVTLIETSAQDNINFSDHPSIPKFKDGPEKLVIYFQENKRKISNPIPPNSLGNRVLIEYTVDKTGKTKDIKIIEGLGEPFDSEAIRLYSNLPNWIPAKENGKPIEKVMTGNVSFGNISSGKVQEAWKKYSLGMDFYFKGKYEKALKNFNKAIESNPTVLDYYLDRAATFFELQNDAAACKDLDLIKGRDDQAEKLFMEKCGF